MTKRLNQELSKRERQIMEVIYRKKSASVAEVLQDIPGPPSYSSVRTILKILEEKGFLTHRKQGRKYLYRPTIPHSRAKLSAMKQLLQTYFNNSVGDAVATLIKAGPRRLTESDYKKLIDLIEEVSKEEQ